MDKFKDFFHAPRGISKMDEEYLCPSFCFLSEQLSIQFHYICSSTIL